MVKMKRTERIPRIIHYCWFGRGPKTRKMKMCLRSWQNHLPDYEWMEWNEDCFNVHAHPYVEQAYEARKYAFVSDYVRLFALYRYGGIYMDTDVEVLKGLDRFLHHEAFTGFEDDHYLPTGIIGAAQGHPWIGSLLDGYEGRTFLQADGTNDLTTNTSTITDDCLQRGFVLNGKYQEVDGVAVYPRSFFCPYDYINGAMDVTDESYTIHHFTKSWLPAHVRARGQLKQVAARYIGPNFVSKLRALWEDRI